MAMGEMLAEEVKRVLAAENLHVDVVIPVGHFFLLSACAPLDLILWLH